MVLESRARRCILHLKMSALSCDACSAQATQISIFDVDHYGGLSETWDNGTIYCSEQTARLIQHMDQLRIRKELIKPLPMDVAVTVEGTHHLDATGRPSVLFAQVSCSVHITFWCSCRLDAVIATHLIAQIQSSHKRCYMQGLRSHWWMPITAQVCSACNSHQKVHRDTLYHVLHCQQIVCPFRPALPCRSRPIPFQASRWQEVHPLR